MLRSVLVGVALARLFTVPNAPNVASPYADTATSPLLPRPVLENTQVLETYDTQVPQYVVVQPPRSNGSAAATLGVAVAVAGLGFVAGRQAMLFTSSGSRSASPKTGGRSVSKINAEGRARNRGGPYQSNKKNIQTQRSGFGNFVQKFQTVSGKSKYGVPIFLPNGNVNPAYLAAERKDMQAQSKKNTTAAEIKRKGLISKGAFELADYVRKRIGPVGSGTDYYKSGR